MFLSLWLLSVVGLGCEHVDAHKEPTAKEGEARQDIPLTEALARQSLVTMLEDEDSPSFDTWVREIAALKNGQHMLIMERDAVGLLSGYWNCDLEAKRFSFLTPIGTCMYDCHGIFEMENGQWCAKVTGTSWAHFGLEGPP